MSVPFDSIPSGMYQWIIGGTPSEESEASRLSSGSQMVRRGELPEAAIDALSTADKDAIKFQIRATVLSWSFAWNRGDAIGYCDGYTDEARYVSVSANGCVTELQGKENIAACFGEVFAKCQAAQTKLEQRSKMKNSVLVTGVAGNMEYSNLEIQLISPCNAKVFGEYQLIFANDSEQRGVFTLHMEESSGIWRIQSEHSTALAVAT